MNEQRITEPDRPGTGSLVAPRPVRLSVNLAPDVAVALGQLVSKHGASITEEVRRAISVYKFVDEQTDAGHRLMVERDKHLFEVKFFE